MIESTGSGSGPVLSAVRPAPLQPAGFAVRFLPSLVDFAFLTPLLILFGLGGGASGLLADGDTGWHIRTGEWILRNGRIPTTDIFSYTRSGERWFAWEWLWDVIFGWFHLHWGMEAVILLSTVLICLTCGLLYVVVRQRCENVFIAFAITMLAVVALSTHWLARPLLVTPLFLLLFLLMLERANEGETRWLIGLPLLTVLWTNLHGGFVAGLTLVAAYAASELLRSITAPSKDASRAALRRSGPYILAALACLIASCANPFSYHLHAHIVQHLLNPFFREYIAEWGAYNFQQPGAAIFEVLIVAGAIAAFQNVRRREFVYPLLFVVWLHSALVSARHLPVFAVLCAPFVASAAHELLHSIKDVPVARWIQSVVSRFEEQASEFSRTDRIARFHIISLVATAVLGAVFYAPSPPQNFRAAFDSSNFPAQAVDALRKHDLPPNLFTTDLWGGYLIYHLYPKVRVFIDGRADFYGRDFVRRYVDLLNGRNGWKELLRQHGVNTVLLPAGAPLARILQLSSGWKLVYDDGRAIIFRRS